MKNKKFVLGALLFAASVVANASERTFGQQLFAGGFQGAYSAEGNEDYLVSVGDMVDIHIWGAIDNKASVPVDSNGYIFVPKVGPIKLKGVKQSDVQAVVEMAVSEEYKKSVKVYANVQGIKPISVYVSGFVTSPGNYSGIPNESVISFLSKAGGIADDGSYRAIKVVRSGEVVQNFDLYSFLTKGDISLMQFKEGDVILVEKRKSEISVNQGVASPSINYEIPNKGVLGRDALTLFDVAADVSHFVVSTKGGKESFYLTEEEFLTHRLSDGATVEPVSDIKQKTIEIKVAGEISGDRVVVVDKGLSLGELLSHIAVNKDLSVTSQIYLKRKSLAKQEKASIQRALNRLEKSYLSASSSTSEEANIRTQEAKLISDFVKKASQIEPEGRMVLSDKSGLFNVLLEAGDEIVIPVKSGSVMVSGEVFAPRSLMYQQGLSVLDYIAKTGSFTEQADEDRVLVISQGGEIKSGMGASVNPGDEIMVLPKVPVKNIQLAKTVAQIAYNLAVAAKVVIDL